MPSLIPFLLAEADLPRSVQSSLRTYVHTPDPHARHRARMVVAAGLREAFDLTDGEVADLLEPVVDGGYSGGVPVPSPRAASASSARAQNT